MNLKGRYPAVAVVGLLRCVWMRELPQMDIVNSVLILIIDLFTRGVRSVVDRVGGKRLKE